MRFEWNPGKAEENLRKHGVAFSEAETVFHDSLAVTFEDSDHSVGEHRFLTIGHSSAGRLVVVSHVEDGETIRIISARPASAHERKRHET